ncbi:hypothetical protein GGQ68_003585 [Sagittula marina]|uniref:Uncharacterized protein n=1 Tax=Sagittula marina TaxID=943940 RepID=A0A7W6DXV3_9RHOB|nr:hypothetical protein [Sagittula marina]MBB3987239.1 hypothetical protein [Sagittula marina]
MESETGAEFIQGDIALWMGWESLTGQTGTVTKNDKGFGCKRDDAGVLRIILRQSSLPCQP